VFVAFGLSLEEVDVAVGSSTVGLGVTVGVRLAVAVGVGESVGLGEGV